MTANAPDGWEVTQLPEERIARLADDPPLELLAGIHYLLIADHPLTAEMVAAAPDLALVQHQGVGYEQVDLAALAARGIPFSITPDGTAAGVAEHVFALLLALDRHIPHVDAALRRGEWLQWEMRATSYMIAGKTIGIVGFGRIGQAVAKRALAFEAVPLFCDPHLPEDFEFPGATRVRQLHELLAKSDVVTLHLPAVPGSPPLIGAEQLAGMRPGSALINTARGAVLDYDALLAALDSGHLRGAGLDVFRTEPIDPADPLLERGDVVITPHIASGTIDAYTDKMRGVFRNFLRHHEGGGAANVVTTHPHG